MLKTMTVLFLAMLCAALGNVLIRKGLQTIGILPSRKISTLLKFFFKAALNPLVLLGIIISVAYFFLWLVVLSWADVSWALPMNAVEYLFVALFAGFYLKEKIGPYRWAGMGLIFLGMLFLMGSWGG